MGVSYMAAGLRYGVGTAQSQMEKVAANPLEFMANAWRGVNGMKAVTRGGGAGALIGGLGSISRATKTWGATPEAVAQMRKLVDAEKGATVMSGAAADAKRQLDLLERLNKAGIDDSIRKANPSAWDYMKANPDKRSALIGAVAPDMGTSALKGAAAGTAAYGAAQGAKSALQARAIQPYLMPAAIGGGAMLGYGMAR